MAPSAPTLVERKRRRESRQRFLRGILIVMQAS
jgi:hypothetical protein